MPNKPITIADALTAATRYWGANEGNHGRGPNMMPIRAGRCASILGLSRKLSTLGAPDGASLLVGLRSSGLARSSVASYYGAGRRMLALSGLPCTDWPKAPTAPRKVLQPVDHGEVLRLIADLEAKGWSDTASLVRLMLDTGLRVEVEALRGDWSVDAAEGRLTVHAGKGGHGRVVPYRGNLSGPLSGITYEGHLRRIKSTGTHLRPHDLRRAFIKGAYERSGKDIRVAQVLAGHADPGTTAGYIGVDFGEMERAVFGGVDRPEGGSYA